MPPHLIIINGPSGVGKSTTAAILHERMPLSFLLDIDAQSRFISHYREYSEERWELSKAVSLAIVDAALSLSRSVIVDKMIYESSTLDQYRSVGERHSATITEIILWAPKDVVMERAHARGWRPGGLLTPEKCELLWEKINALKDQRPIATLLDVSHLKPTQTADIIFGTLLRV
jgi:tRNA uridine 5-carbamoylmethylation protein Kti12